VTSGCLKNAENKTPLLREVHNIKYLLIILCNDVETNPGPKLLDDLIIDNKNLFICSYNLQGCNNFKKIKRVMNQFNKLPFSNNCIINLQETHWTDKNSIQYHWKGGHIQSNHTSASRGVAILFNKSYFDEIIESYTDNDGRMCSVTASKEGEIYCFVNIYSPNDHYVAINFYSLLLDHMLDVQSKHPNVNLVVSGDFNVIFNPNVDSIGRAQSRKEKEVVEKIKSIKNITNLFDTYRHIHKYGGFTWSKDNPQYLRSRLDHILVSKSMQNQLVNSVTTNLLMESDHSFLF